VVFTSVEERLVFGNSSRIGNCGELWSYWLYWELWGTMVVLVVLGTMENCGCIDLSANYGNRSLFYTKIYKPDWDILGTIEGQTDLGA
jgi:hypothetical protein